MDPDAALDDLRAAMDALDTDEPADPAVVGDATAAFAALDEWLSAGGFSPSAWRR